MSKLLNNLPVEDLTEENDYLGIIDKGQIIKTFLESNTDEFKDIKMFSLYGEWGSGKSTLMKYLQKELKGNFNTFFFEAWQFESDNNLSLSLLEYLSYESSDTTDEALGEIVELAAKLFRGFSKSVRISIPGFSIDGNKIVDSLEEELEESFYQLKQKFEKEFKKWEGHVTRGENPKFNIVFIDDLDRCEPENVLNLLSALKLFFTYGEKTIFFCGIDEKAINEAVRTKYGKVVKANEYLEKVFDISFSMPEHDDLLKLSSQYFVSKQVESFDGNLNENISDFFKQINFTNPRRVKKILNKYQILSNLKENCTDDSFYKSLIPNIIVNEEGDFFETIFTLYFLILHGFYQDIFNDFYNIEKKKSNYMNLESKDNDGRIYDFDMKFLEYTFTAIQAKLKTNHNDSSEITFVSLIRSFAPINPSHIGTYIVFRERQYFEREFLVPKKRIDYFFTLYIMTRLDFMKQSSKLSNFNFNNFKLMINKLL